MFRVLAARSLRFNEEGRQGDAPEVVVKKASEVSFRQDPIWLRLVAGAPVDPEHFALWLEAKARELDKEARGLWSPTGRRYAPLGEPDLELGAPYDAATRHGEAAHSARARVEALVSLFHATKALLHAEAARAIGRDKDAVVSDAVEVAARRASVDVGGGRGEGESGGDDSAAPTTLQRLLMLGVEQREAPRPRRERASQRWHLDESLVQHAVRWRGEFEVAKRAANARLVEELRLRALRAKRGDSRGAHASRAGKRRQQQQQQQQQQLRKEGAEPSRPESVVSAASAAV